MSPSISNITSYNQFVETFGSDAAEKARNAGYIDGQNRLVGDADWKRVAQWLTQGQDQRNRDIPPPGNTNDARLETALRSFENISILFHTILKNVRTTQREESFVSQQRIVETMKSAADKRIEAADKLKGMAGLCLGLAIGGMGAGVAMGALSGVFQAMVNAVQNAVKAAVNAIKNAIGKTLAKITESTAKVVDKAVEKAVKEAAKAATEAAKNAARDSVKEATEAATKAVNEVAQKAGKQVAEQVKTQLQQAVKSSLEGMPKKVQESAQKMIEKIAQDAGKAAQKSITNALKDTCANFGQGMMEMVDQTVESLQKTVSKSVSDSMYNVLEQALEKAASETLLTKLGQGALQTLANPMTASQMGTQSMSGASQFAQTRGQSESQTTQADADKIQAQAEYQRSEKQRLDDYTSGINDTMRTIRQKIQEMNEAQVKAMEAAAKA